MSWRKCTGVGSIVLVLATGNWMKVAGAQEPPAQRPSTPSTALEDHATQPPAVAAPGVASSEQVGAPDEPAENAPPPFEAAPTGAPPSPVPSASVPAPSVPSASVPSASVPSPSVPPSPAMSQAAPSVVAAPSAAPSPSPSSPLSDHLKAGSWGFGVTSIEEPLPPIAVVFGAGQTQTANSGEEGSDAWIPALTARRWFGADKRWAAELALTYYFADLSNRAGSGTEGSIFATRVGFPIAFASTQHTTFEVIPQLNYLGAGASDGQQQVSVFEWNAVLRLVAEIHFGFIGLPELAVQSGLGAMWTRQVICHRINYNGVPLVSAGSLRRDRWVATSVRPFGGRGPWEIFVGNLSALYYF